MYMQLAKYSIFGEVVKMVHNINFFILAQQNVHKMKLKL